MSLVTTVNRYSFSHLTPENLLWPHKFHFKENLTKSKLTPREGKSELCIPEFIRLHSGAYWPSYSLSVVYSHSSPQTVTTMAWKNKLFTTCLFTQTVY